MSALHPRVLIIDDDPKIHRYLRPALIEAGYRPTNIASGVVGLQSVNTHPPDAIILDIELRDIRGEDLISGVRQIFQGPVLVLSARTRDIEKINALDLGADDFVAKPFGVGELLARLRVAFRRRILGRGIDPVVQAQGLSVDLIRRTVTLQGSFVSLTNQQYTVLARLAAAGGAALTLEDLAALPGPKDGAPNLQKARVVIRQLRNRIERTPKSPMIITTERSVGYRLCVDRH